MSDQLKTFIMENRIALDSFEPSDALWHNIEQSIPSSGTSMTAKGGNGNAWWKLGLLGTGVIAVATFFALDRAPHHPEPSPTPTSNTMAALVPEDDVQQEQSASVLPTLKQDANGLAEEAEVLEETAGISPINATSKETNPRHTEVVYIGLPPTLEDTAPQHSKASQDPANNPLTATIDSPDAKVKMPKAPKAPKAPKDPNAPKLKAKDKIKTEPATTPAFADDGVEVHNKIDTAFTGIKSVEVQGIFCDIYLMPSGSNQTTVKGNIDIKAKGKKSQLDDVVIHAEKQGDKLIVRLGKEKECNGISLYGRSTVRSEIKIGLAADVTDIKARNSSGNLTINDFQGKTLDAQTISGDLIASDIKAEFKARSSSGNIKVNQLTGSFDASSISGSLDIVDIKGTMTISSSSGDIQIKDGNGNLTINSISGDQIIHDLQGDVTANASSGDISLTDVKGDLTLNTISGDIICKEVTLKTALTANSSSGDHSISLNNKIGELSFNLKSSSGDLRIRKEGNEMDGERKLVWNEDKGTIKVTGQSISGDQSYR